MSEQSEENEPDSPEDAKPLIKMLQDAEKVFEPWQSKCDSIDKQYANLERLANDQRDRSFQVFWANMEVMRGVVYQREPQPVCVPRFSDRREIDAKASEILERCLSVSFDTEKAHKTFLRIRDNLCLHARGVLWERYDAEGEGDKFRERVRYEWKNRRDFLHDPRRIWSEVGWVAGRVWLTEDEGEDRFGDKWDDKIHYESDAKDTADGYKQECKAAVWEIWHKARNKVYWVHPNSDVILDQKDPWLTLDGFFPCPEPVYGTTEPDSLVPVPDFLFYKDQVEEVIDLTKRISALTQAVKMRGFYAKGDEQVGETIEKLLKDQDDRQVLIGIPNMTGIAGTALKDSVVWLPIADVVSTIKALIEERRVLMDDIYQISGISDIMRGQTEASETLGAQQIKTQYGSIRVRGRQGEMVRLADDALNIAGEIMAEQFQPKTLLKMSQIDGLATHSQVQEQINAIKQQIANAQQNPQVMQQAQQNPQMAQQLLQQAKGQIAKLEQTVTVESVMQLLRAERMRPFSLKVATDSTITPDENAEKQRRTEFLAALGQSLAQLGGLVKAEPKAAKFAGETLKFAMAPYRVGRDLNSSIDEFVEEMETSAGQPPPPNPDQIKAEAEAKDRELDRKLKEAEMASQERQSQADAALRAREQQLQAQEDQRAQMIAQAEAEAKVLEIQRRAQAETEKFEHDRQLRAIDLEIAQIRLAEAQAKHMAPVVNGEGRA